MATRVSPTARRFFPLVLTAAACASPDATDPGSTGTDPGESTAVDPGTTASTGTADPGSSSSSGGDEVSSTGPLATTSSESDGGSSSSSAASESSGDAATSSSESGRGTSSVGSDTSSGGATTDPTDPGCPPDGGDDPYCWPCGGGGWCVEGEVCVAACEPAAPAPLCDAVLLGSTLPWPGADTVGISALAFGDVDGDALADLFIVGDGTLSLVLGAGGSSSIGITADGPNAIVVGDFDGSGTTDVVVLPGEDLDTLDVVTTDAAGALTLETSESSDWIWSAVAGDFDGSGTLDLLTAGPFPGEGLIRFGNGDGTFDDPFVHVLDAAFLAAADFDGDGSIDVAASDLELWTGNASLDFGDVQLLHGTFHEGLITTEYYTGIVAAQFDGDGIPDLAAAGITFPNSTAYSLGWRGAPAGAPEILGTPSVAGRTLAADLDGDGHDDLVEIGEDAQIGIALGRADVGESLFSCWTSATPPFGVPAPGAFMAFGAAAAGDIDGDGDDELALSDGEQVVLLATP